MTLSKKVIVFIIIFALLTISVHAEETLITIILPEATTESAMPPEKPPISVPKLYPVSVTENAKKGRREIVKTYELSVNEKPSDIPRENFERDGWFYEIADITKKENIKIEQKNQSDTVKINSDTKDFDEVLKLLPKSKNYNSGGFTGTLTLDVNSIEVEQAGTKSVAYTISEMREYPYLSSNDSSFVPKTIADRYGRTLTLSSLTWRTSNTAVDYDQIPESYTAVASYTATAYKSVITGYTVTAEYRGTIINTSPDKTVYTALFIGIEIVSPAIETMAEIVPKTPEVTEIPTESEIVATTESFTEKNTITETVAPIEVEITTEVSTLSATAELTEPLNTEPDNNPFNPILIIIIILEAVGFGGFIIYYIKKNQGGNIIEKDD